jgi:tetratricopeptide (TPR) repeat protein
MTALVTVALAAGLAPGAPPRPVNSVDALLDQYATGQFGEAVRSASRTEDVGAFVKEFERAAPLWIAVQPADLQRRRLAVATFSLEVADARMIDAWRTYRNLVEWSCRLLRQGVPDPGEHSWQLASVALAERAGDCHWAFDNCASLEGPVMASGSTANHLRHAKGRFADDARFRLAEAILVNKFIEVEGPSAAGASLPAYQRYGFDKYAEQAAREFGPLTAVPAIAGAAELHVAQLFFVVDNSEGALQHARLALAKSDDPIVQYVARMISGRALEGSGRPAEAVAAYRAALAVWPGGQSATIKLASLETMAGHLDEAYALVERSFATPVRDDPWRLFGYGDYVRFPGWIAELRRQIQP